MRESKVLRKLRSNQNANCLKANIGDAQATEIACMAGFDCLWIDREHLAQDWSVLNSQILAAKYHDTDVMVRVSRGGYSDYIKPLEMDATGIMVPHVMSAEDAKQVVKWTRFHPTGLRPIDGGSADGAYTRMDFNEYIKQANEQRFIVLQIEDIEALKELDKIAAVPGYDMLFFGPGDFSQSLGAPGDWNNPKLLEARKAVAKAARDHGKFAATSGGINSLEQLLDDGYQFINIGADVVGLGSYCDSLIQRFTNTHATRENTQAPGKPY